MLNQQAQYMADMSNSAEAAILTILNKENPKMLDWYMNLPRQTRAEIAIKAAKETMRNLRDETKT